MDKTSLTGVVLGFIAIGAGMILKGVDIAALINPAAILVILVGTAASVIIAFPSSEIKRIPKLFGIIFKEQNMPKPKDLILLFSDMAQLARREGLLALESRLDEIDDPFLKQGLILAVDGQNADYIRDVLSDEIDAMEERHAAGAAIFPKRVRMHLHWGF